jgi:hypothetical protein
MAQVLRLGYGVRRQVEAAQPAVTSLLVVTNAGPGEVLDNTATGRLVAAWRRYPKAAVHTLALAASLNLGHDYIDPNHTEQPVDVVEIVYPQLLAAIRQLP